MTHSWWPRIRPRAGTVGGAALLGGLALALTTAGFVGSAAATPGSSAPTPVASQECAPGDAASDARVRPGAKAHDPNELTAAEVAAAERTFGNAMRSKRIDAKKLAIYPRVTVRVAVHVITGAGGAGQVTDNQIARQINVLNQAFAGRVNAVSPRTLFSFRLVETTRTANNDWYNWAYPEPGADPDDLEAKTQLHRGGPETLNLYIANLGDGLLGYASFPSERAGALDGVVLLNESLPGGTAAPYNLGDTATHEIGHWLGLYHTFQDGCVPDGDEVPDTPAQLDDSNVSGGNVYNCIANLDTCANRPGRDPVYNFMNYVDDACMNRFTPGQAQRMALQWYSFRASNA